MSKENLAFRFKEERIRLELTHAQVGEICGVSRNSVMAWEQGAKIPADALIALVPSGLDPLYVITGQHSGERLENRESSLLDNYRHSDERGKRIIEQTASAAAEPAATYEVKKA